MTTPIDGRAVPPSEVRQLFSLTRRCVADKARLRRERWATVDDAREFLEALRIDTRELSEKVIAANVFATPDWHYDGLWTAVSRRAAASGGRRHMRRTVRLVRLYRLRAPEEMRREAAAVAKA